MSYKRLKSDLQFESLVNVGSCQPFFTESQNTHAQIMGEKEKMCFLYLCICVFAICDLESLKCSIVSAVVSLEVCKICIDHIDDACEITRCNNTIKTQICWNVNGRGCRVMLEKEVRCC